jgi:hypothetical protein
MKGKHLENLEVDGGIMLKYIWKIIVYGRRPLCSSGQCACHWTQGSRIQTRLRGDGFLRAIKIRSTLSEEK